MNKENFKDGEKNKTCLKCSIRASFGKKGTKLAEYCKEHIIDGYIDVVSKKCLKCDKQPYFGNKETGIAEYCKEHAIDGYIDVKSIQCLKCNKKPCFGNNETGIAEYCKEHAIDGYIDVKHKRCIATLKSGVKCDKQSYYGKKETKIAEYCKEHAIDGYIDVKHKRCIATLTSGSLCDKRPTFGKEGTKLAEYCKEHAREKTNYTDVINKKCKKCNIRAKYGFLTKEVCFIHKEKGMVSNPGAKCKHKEKDTKCKNKALYGNPLKRQLLYCEDHFKSYNTKNDLYNLIESNCIKCNLIFSLNKDNLCMFCSGYEKKQHEKKYEDQVKLFLEKMKYPVISYNRTIDKNCSLRRPDFIIRGKCQNIIIEVDEYQHLRGSYTPECELSRMKQIFMDNGEKYLTFIRFNPNIYTNKNNRKIKESMKRYNTLEKYINNYIEEIPNEQQHCKAVYLFYDGYDEKTQDIEIINPYN